MRRVPLLLSTMALVALLAASTSPAYADTTFTVNSTSDTDDGLCSLSTGVLMDCTLREAINAANNASGQDTIKFDIQGSGVQTIHVGSTGNDALPTITGPVTIDGYSQQPCSSNPAPCSKPNTNAQGAINANLLIELDGTNAGNSRDGLRIGDHASNTMIKGLVINRFDRYGIDFLSTGPLSGIRVEGNFIGPDSSGTADLGNGFSGVALADSSNSTVGGTLPEARNLISGNGGGISLSDSPGNKVLGNLIGTQKDGASPLGNTFRGVHISLSSNTTVGGTASGAANVIAYNGYAGVNIVNGSGTRILSNSMFSNGDLGIDLKGDGLTPNDPKDADIGPNRLQNFPELSSANLSGGQITIGGSLNSSPRKTFTIQFFSNPVTDPNEGKAFIGETTVKTNRKGDRSFNVTFTPLQSVLVGQRITATATKTSTGDTSEFSENVEVTS